MFREFLYEQNLGRLIWSFFFFHIVIRDDISVSFREKYLNKFLIRVAYGQQYCRPYLVFFRLARTKRYNLFITKELLLTELLEVAASNRCARSVFVSRKKNESYMKCMLIKQK